MTPKTPTDIGETGDKRSRVAAVGGAVAQLG